MQGLRNECLELPSLHLISDCNLFGRFCSVSITPPHPAITRGFSSQISSDKFVKLEKQKWDAPSARTSQAFPWTTIGHPPPLQPPANGLKPTRNSLAPGFYVNLTQTFSSSEALSLFAYDHPLLRGPNPT
jgi:hypothetical protein